MRIVLALLVAVAGFYSVSFSAARLLARSDPERAQRLAPFDGPTTARLAAKLSGPSATKADRQRSDALSRLALRQDPTAVAAVSALGMNAQFRNDAAGAGRFFAYAEKLSRRDMITQLWAIEDSVTRGDIKGALRHYDIVLRVKPEMAALLFPVLTKASTEPAIRAEVVKTLVGKPVWGGSFVNYAAANTPDASATAELLLALGRAKVTVPEMARAGVIDALLAAGRFDQAWAYYTNGRPGFDRRRSRDAQFSAQLKTPTQFDWTPVNDAGVTATIEGGAFDFSAPPSAGGILLRQRQLLPPGSYRLAGRSEGIDQADDSRPYWSLVCQNGRELGRMTVPNSNRSGGNFAGAFTVPADCPVQTLTLTARPSDAVSGLYGRIDGVELRPASQP